MHTNIFSSVIYQEIVGIVFLFGGKQKNKNDTKSENNNHLLCRFVLDGSGKKIGESIAIDEDVLIIKSGTKYLGIPLKHIEEEKKTLLVKGLIDKDMAEIMGEKWRNESFKEIDYSKGNDDEF